MTTPSRDPLRIQKEMLRVVFSRKFKTEKKGSPLGQVPSERLELYRDLTRNVIYETLEWVYPLGRKIIAAERGEDGWLKLVDRFVTESPPAHFALIPSVAGFTAVFREGSFERELLDYELCRTESANAPDPGSPSRGPTAWLDPSFRLRAFRRGIPAWYKEVAENQDSPGLLRSRPAKLRRSQVFASIFRNPETGEIRTLELQPLAFAILASVLDDGKSPEEAGDWVARKSKLPQAARKELSGQVSALVLMLIREKAAFARPPRP